jgi:glycosyltransferase involved in cell wall biosynthesis
MKNILFFVRQFCERGTEVATWDYAHYNETILGNKSYILAFSPEGMRKHAPRWFWPRYSYDRFRERFVIIEIESFHQMPEILKKYKIDIFYTMCSGPLEPICMLNSKEIWGNCKIIKHCVFRTTEPEGDAYISIGNYINTLYSTNLYVVPYIVTPLPFTQENLRERLGIPNDAIVFGRHGGADQFDLVFAHDAIKNIIDKYPNYWFVFLNTNVFFEHPRIKYLERTVDLVQKRKFINTCDAMIHARHGGETFGLACAEFSSCNKPVITALHGDKEHIEILGEKAIIYKDGRELEEIFEKFLEIREKYEDWNAYRGYSPEIVMKTKFAPLIEKLSN